MRSGFSGLVVVVGHSLPFFQNVSQMSDQSGELDPWNRDLLSVIVFGEVKENHALPTSGTASFDNLSFHLEVFFVDRSRS